MLSLAAQTLSSAIPAANNQSGESSSTTHASISAGNITIGGKEATAEQLNGLSRDTSDSANALKPIFDLQKVQDRMAMATVVGEIGVLATSVTAKAMTRNEYVALDQAQADYERDPSAENAAALVIAQDNYAAAQAKVGPGSPFATAAQSLTGLAVGIAGGNIQQGLSNALTPYLAGAVGGYFDSLETGPDGQKHPTPETTAGRLLAHAAVGAAVAYASGGDAASGAAGAVVGEAMAMIVMKLNYPGLTADDLTVEQKEHIRAIATLASGLVGAATGNSFEAATTAAAAGYNAVSNNFLTAHQLVDVEKAYQDCGTDEACKQRVKDGANALSAAQDVALTKAKIKCSLGYCDDLNAINKLKEDSVYYPALVRHIKFAHPDWTDAKVSQKADEYIAEQIASSNASMSRTIIGTLDAVLPIAGVGSVVSIPVKAGTRLIGKEVAQITKRIGRDGDAVEVIFKDGTKMDITAVRVKEFVPNPHPNAPAGTLQKVKYEVSLPGTKGYKRAPTAEELRFLNNISKR